MATILDLFKSRKEEVYGGTAGVTYIESNGIVNIPRKVALLASSPNAIGGLIGNEIGGLIKGSADRASDTIFKGKEAYRKPLIISPGAITRGLRYAVEEGEQYYVKRFNEPPSFINKITQGASTAGSVIQEEAAKFLKNPNNTIDAVKTIGSRLKGIKGDSQTYGPSLMEDKNLTLRKSEKTFTKFAPKYKKNSSGGFTQTDLVERSPNSKTIDDIIKHTIAAEYITDAQGNPIDLSEFQKLNQQTGGSYVLFENYNKTSHILLPGTVSGISENMTPEISNFKYLGSPFNLYRYGGVERTLQFNLKMYYIDTSSKISMIRKLDLIRELVFPSSDIAAITYPSSEKSQALLAIKPNLVWLTISGVYKEVFGIIDSLSFSIDDTASWPSTVSDNLDQTGKQINADEITIQNKNSRLLPSKYEEPYPSVIDVSVGMKIIESPQIEKDGSDYSYIYRKNKQGKDLSYFTKPYELNAFTNGTEY